MEQSLLGSKPSEVVPLGPCSANSLLEATVSTPPVIPSPDPLWGVWKKLNCVHIPNPGWDECQERVSCARCLLTIWYKLKGTPEQNPLLAAFPQTYVLIQERKVFDLGYALQLKPHYQLSGYRERIIQNLRPLASVSSLSSQIFYQRHQ